MSRQALASVVVAQRPCKQSCSILPLTRMIRCPEDTRATSQQRVGPCTMAPHSARTHKHTASNSLWLSHQKGLAHVVSRKVCPVCQAGLSLPNLEYEEQCRGGAPRLWHAGELSAQFGVAVLPVSMSRLLWAATASSVWLDSPGSSGVGRHRAPRHECSRAASLEVSTMC